MSVYGEGLDVTLGLAAVDLSSYQYCPVKLITGSSVGTVDISDAAAEVVNGILQNTPTAGQPAVVRVSGMSKMKAGAAIAVGVKLVSKVTAGRAIGITGTAVGDNDEFVFGFAATAAGADGDLFEGLICMLGINQARAEDA